MFRESMLNRIQYQKLDKIINWLVVHRRYITVKLLKLNSLPLHGQFRQHQVPLLQSAVLVYFTVISICGTLD